MNPPKAERAKPSLSSDYNLLFKNKIGERSLDIHRNGPYVCNIVVHEKNLNAPWLNNPRLKARGFLTRCRLSRNSQGF